MVRLSGGLQLTATARWRCSRYGTTDNGPPTSTLAKGTALMGIFGRRCHRLPAANTIPLQHALKGLQQLLPNPVKENSFMSAPTGLVSIAQSDLDTFATNFEAVKTALSTYIAQLVANQATPLPAADESGLTQALSDLTALEPPAPAPVTPPSP